MSAPRLAALAATAVVAALTLQVRAAVSAPAPAQQGPLFVHLNLDAREYSLGRSDAPLTLLEFTDYQCPYCRRFQSETWPLLKKNFIDTGKLRFIVRDLPLQFHSTARPAAEAAHCAGEQGKFWEMHHALLTGSDPLNAAGIDRRAREVGLDLERLHSCIQARSLRGGHCAQHRRRRRARDPRHARVRARPHGARRPRGAAGRGRAAVLGVRGRAAPAARRARRLKRFAPAQRRLGALVRVSDAEQKQNSANTFIQVRDPGS